MPSNEVTVLNADSWLAQPQQLAQILAHALAWQTRRHKRCRLRAPSQPRLQPLVLAQIVQFRGPDRGTSNEHGARVASTRGPDDHQLLRKRDAPMPRVMDATNAAPASVRAAAGLAFARWSAKAAPAATSTATMTMIASHTGRLEGTCWRPGETVGGQAASTNLEARRQRRSAHLRCSSRLHRYAHA